LIILGLGTPGIGLFLSLLLGPFSIWFIAACLFLEFIIETGKIENTFKCEAKEAEKPHKMKTNNFQNF